ncbi:MULTISPECIES: HPP family protein [Caballeronia]|nr:MULTISPECIES: CBS domain-containing protein [Caballeronia]
MSIFILPKLRATVRDAISRLRFKYSHSGTAARWPIVGRPRDSRCNQLEQQARFRMLLEMSCAQVMHTPVTTVHGDATAGEALALLDKTGFKLLPVIDRERRLLGVVARDDLRPARQELQFASRAAGRHGGELIDEEVTVHAVMQSDVSTIDADTPISKVLPRFMANGHHHFPVVRNGAELVGMLTQSDLLMAVCGDR